MNVPPHVSSAALWGRALLALRVARPAALALALAIAPSAALAEGGALMRARAIECRLDAFTQCGAWFRACETRRASDESKEERLRFDLALKRIEMHPAPNSQQPRPRPRFGYRTRARKISATLLDGRRPWTFARL